MKQLLFSNWHIMRIIRLLFGLFSLQQAFQYREILFGVMAAFFLFQAIFNTGCSLNECSIPKNKTNNEQ
ncbi:hypothetical protein B6A10_09025 [Flavobacterium sp. L1I52]|uniref:DUF2892 domain-containing protein n=1 Tax=Flavobacterium pokkalii TaxID=1940408 RepID=A0ABR7URJ1_9FLAO|nr:hypothetical protein [Flavobacterium pokkalii]MBD0725319.1 hypothetical protein [Flavobacterium pokkalii]